jgi:hypothetical protein
VTKKSLNFWCLVFCLFRLLKNTLLWWLFSSLFLMLPNQDPFSRYRVMYGVPLTPESKDISVRYSHFTSKNKGRKRFCPKMSIDFFFKIKNLYSKFKIFKIKKKKILINLYQILKNWNSLKSLLNVNLTKD